VNTRFIAFGTVATVVTLFAWQSISNAAIPWHTATMRPFTNGAAVVQAIRAGAPENGVYFSERGILAAVSLTPDLADKSQAMGPNFVKQAGIDLVVAVVLCLLVLRLPAAGPVKTGVTLGAAALAVASVIELSDWNWYGFAASYELVNVIDQTIAFFIAGLVLGAIRRRVGGTNDAVRVEEAPVLAGGGLPQSSSHRATAAR
jgi:hypothetical protein